MTADARPDGTPGVAQGADQVPPAKVAAWGASRGLLALAIAVLVMAGASGFWPWGAEVAADTAAVAHAPVASPRPPDASSPAETGPDAATPAVAADGQVAAPAMVAVGPPRIVRHRDPDGDLTPDLADHVNEGDVPSMAEVIRRLHAAGVHTGLGAFSPPGTRPPLIGLAVPEGFPLPEGFVRHYQATDDGQRIEPILMFAPNPSVPDAGGRSIVLPADRVVPPELAPAGLPIRRIELPAPVNGRARGG